MVGLKMIILVARFELCVGSRPKHIPRNLRADLTIRSRMTLEPV